MPPMRLALGRRALASLLHMPRGACLTWGLPQSPSSQSILSQLPWDSWGLAYTPRIHIAAHVSTVRA